MHVFTVPAEKSGHGTPEGTPDGTSIRSLPVLNEREEELMRKTLAALDAEWRECSRSPETAQALRRWAAVEPALAGLSDLADLLRARRNPEAAPAILSALARLALGDDLAARTLLRAVMPGLVAMAARELVEDPNAFEEMVSLAWQRVRTYPPPVTGRWPATSCWTSTSGTAATARSRPRRDQAASLELPSSPRHPPPRRS